YPAAFLDVNDRPESLSQTAAPTRASFTGHAVFQMGPRARHGRAVLYRVRGDAVSTGSGGPGRGGGGRGRARWRARWGGGRARRAPGGPAARAEGLSTVKSARRPASVSTSINARKAACRSRGIARGPSLSSAACTAT